MKKRKSPVADYKKRYRKLFLKAERLWKECAILRDGRRCQVQKYFSMPKLKHSEIIQVDHFIPRGDHNLFFNPHNSTVVCSNCNGAKKWKGVQEEMIRSIVMKREGGEMVGMMIETHLKGEPNLNWKSAEWLEESVIPMLEEYKEKVCGQLKNEDSI
jgi:hypothetical protein